MILYQINANPSAAMGSRLASSPRLTLLNRKTVDLIKREYRAAELPWAVGFSGGKDSSALLKLIYEALRQVGDVRKRVAVVYCDTGVEIPVISGLVRDTLSLLSVEAKEDGVPIDVHIAQPRLDDRYFVKVIGRGYPPPSNKFRWCTDRLRINPVRRTLESLGADGSIVLLGVRRGESVERDKVISRHQTSDQFYFRQTHSAKTLIFSPIIDYNLEDVWSTIQHIRVPTSINAQRLISLYKDASGECPIVRDPKGAPCGKGRFGCWTCTVVRKDRAMQSMVAEGWVQLQPLLEWRNWLASVRDNLAYRCGRRRNGQLGLGPFTLKARREILSKLLAVQSAVPWEIVTSEEIKAIKELWKLDKLSSSYIER